MIRDAYVLVDERDNTNAANNSQKQLALQRANLCDRFLLEVMDVKRSAEKASALFLKTSFGEKVAAINSSLDKATAAATQAFGSPKLAKLVEIAMALGDILRKGETEKNHGVTTRQDSLPDNEKDNERRFQKVRALRAGGVESGRAAVARGTRRGGNSRKYGSLDQFIAASRENCVAKVTRPAGVAFRAVGVFWVQ